MSETFFKHYGDKGHIYFGSQGIKNFLNDVFRGKNRYDSCVAQTLYWPIDQNNQDYLDYIRLVGNKNAPVFAEILFTVFKGDYLLQVVWVKTFEPNKKKFVSRYVLDRCERLDATQFKLRLHAINSEKAQALFNRSSFD